MVGVVLSIRETTLYNYIPFAVAGVHSDNQGVIHFGPVGSGRDMIRGATARQEFAYKHGIQAFDKEFDQVRMH